ncbi:MAG TPA: hypothetical protein PKC18_12185, partial [Lacipirellulaceae bacterium]|nr:hypothetical protein [Lacipirellulaceae bacterium]
PNALGPPAAERMGPIDGDVLRIELVLDSPPLLPLLGGAGELHHLFVGVRDFRSPLTVDRGRLGAGAPRAELVRMYVGAWPKPGLLKLFGDPQLAEGPEPTPAGADVWQGKREDVLLMSFKPDVVQEILPQLTRTPVERPGQLWVDVADLSGTEISATVNALGYARGRESSLAASRLMNTLAHQLHVPWEQCRDVAERLVDGTFVCPLGGEYELADVPGGRPLWASTAVTPQNRFLLDAPPEDFQTPALSWFRGLRADLSMVDAELAGHLEIDLARSAVP